MKRLISIDSQLDSAMMRFKEKEHEEALSICEDVLEQYPENARAYRVRSAIRAAMGCRDDALADLDKAVKLDPGDPSNYFTRGRRYLFSGDFQLAVQDLSAVIQMERHKQDQPFSDSARFFRAEAYLRLGLYDRALADCAVLPDDFALYLGSMRSKEEIEREAKDGQQGLMA